MCLSSSDELQQKGNLILVHLYIFPYLFFQRFLYFGFVQFEYDILRYSIVCVCVSCHLSSLVFFMFPRSVVWCLTLTLKNFSLIIAPNISSVTFSLIPFFIFPLYIGYTFCNCPTFPGYSVLIFLFVCLLILSCFLFAFQCWTFLLTYFQA